MELWNLLQIGDVVKLLVCRDCYDVVKLQLKDFRRCACGRSKGMYLADGRRAVYAGPAIVMGIDNNEFGAMLRSARMGAQAHRPEAFVIPEGPTLEKLKT